AEIDTACANAIAGKKRMLTSDAARHASTSARERTRYDASCSRSRANDCTTRIPVSPSWSAVSTSATRSRSARNVGRESLRYDAEETTRIGSDAKIASVSSGER